MFELSKTFKFNRAHGEFAKVTTTVEPRESPTDASSTILG
jgi:hypothetical protein